MNVQHLHDRFAQALKATGRTAADDTLPVVRSLADAEYQIGTYVQPNGFSRSVAPYPALAPDGGLVIEIASPMRTPSYGLPNKLTGRRISQETDKMETARWHTPPSITLVVPNNPDAALPAVWRVLTTDQMLRLDFRPLLDELSERVVEAITFNLAEAERVRSHPANREYLAGLGRTKAITAEMPSNSVDQFMVDRLGYDSDEVDAWASATIRSRRRIVRNLMTEAARTPKNRARLDAIVNDARGQTFKERVREIAEQIAAAP